MRRAVTRGAGCTVGHGTGDACVLLQRHSLSRPRDNLRAAAALHSEQRATSSSESTERARVQQCQHQCERLHSTSATELRVRLLMQVISLHLFEARYRVMMQRVVESTNCFAYLPNFTDYHARAGDVRELQHNSTLTVAALAHPQPADCPPTAPA